MNWYYFYDKYSEVSESKLKSYISLLEDIDSGCELVDVLLDIESYGARELLINKAIKLKTELDGDDFERLDGEIPSELYVKLAKEGKLAFGSVERVVSVLNAILDEPCRDALYERAIRTGLDFSGYELEWISNDKERNSSATASRKLRGGLFKSLLVFSLLFGSDSGKNHKTSGAGRDSGRCDGNCDVCPPHYGYRYGRWYYGHGHQHRCERLGNGGRSGKCYKD